MQVRCFLAAVFGVRMFRTDCHQTHPRKTDALLLRGGVVGNATDLVHTRQDTSKHRVKRQSRPELTASEVEKAGDSVATGIGNEPAQLCSSAHHHQG
jgi:hypothetical protein